MKTWNFIKLLSIKLKLTFISASVVVIILSIGALSNFFIRRVIVIEDLAFQAHEIESGVLLLRNQAKDFLLSIQNDNQFYTTRKSNKIDEIYTAVNKMNQFAENSNELNMNVFGKKLYAADTILYRLSQYSESFKFMSDDLYLIGNQFHGTKGKITEIQASIKTIVETTYSADIQLSYLKLDILIENIKKQSNGTTIAQFKSEFTNFKTQIENNPNEVSTELLTLLNELNTHIDEYLKQMTTYVGNISKNIQIIKDLEIISKNMVMEIQVLSEKEILSTLRKVMILVLTISIGIIITSIYVSSTMTIPIDRIRKYVNELTQGKLPSPLLLENKDEVTEIANKLNEYIRNLKEKSEFAIKIGNGVFTANLIPISAYDKLGLSLLEMRDSLKKAREEEIKLKEQEAIRNWMSDGIAKFSQLLSTKTESLQVLSDEILFNLIHFINANQGGIFIIKEDPETRESYLDLVSMYAFDRKKAMTKRIEIGEGLVGLCVKELKSNYLEEIPEEYAEIGSAFGYSPPRTLLLVPMMLENRAFGVIELASIKQIQKHHVQLVEIIAENFAGVLWRM